MDRIGISVEVHTEQDVSPLGTFWNTDITLGSTKQAMVRIASEIPFLFTMISREHGKTFLQFTDAMSGFVKVDGLKQSLSDLKRSERAQCIPMTGIWTLELHAESSGVICTEYVAVSFEARPADTSFAENAA